MNLDDIDALADLEWPQDHRLQRLQEIAGTTWSNEPRLKFFYHLVRLQKPMLSVEIGCLRAIVSAYMCAAASEYGGHVIAIDRGLDNIPENVLPELFDNFHFIVGDSRFVGDQIQALVDRYGPIGVVWQDSSHLYQESCEEWDVYRPMMDRNGAVWVCDDLCIHYPEDEGTPGLWGYWLERPGREKKIYWNPSPFRVGATIGVIIL